MNRNIRIVLAILLTSVATSVSAQLLEVGEPTKVEITPTVGAVGSATLSPSGLSLFVTDPGYSGLTRISLSDGATTVISTDEGAGYSPLIVDDDNVAYRRITYTADNLKRTELRRRDLSSGKDASIIGATRTLRGAVSPGDGSVYALDGTKVKTAKIAKGAVVAKRQPLLSIADRQLMLTVGSDTRRISPCGTDESYIWPSVSPDGRKALFFVCGEGAYVSNIDGSAPKFIGIVRAPRWLNNSIVLGMQDTDDGYVTTASTLVAVDITTLQSQQLTDDRFIAMYPTTDKAATKMAFTTPEGDVYIMDITIK